ncbi:undecaprenyl-diphosphate phosphatase [Lutibacter sp.]|uniref:undecaprenyl-diphosphate phosphatase n=1 Tax=Lutibacter sp. TaxID=1925666 RepID=UPI0025C4E218|nr:undecaprenyl-diphosphate phosphatase [Lutibacter sp.]MCF6180456.1 undecaprenyl-diphosphate phosphatase [Lutibacter sp.]
MNYIEVILLAIIEGITEYLPVSSTGHLILASSFLHIAGEDFTKLFTIVIQLGAILAVVVLYWKRFFQSVDFYLKLLVAFIPAVVLGLLFNHIIDELLESPLVVASTLILGGFILLKVDNWFKANEELDNENPSEHTKISYTTAFKIGLFQCLAMIPGTSRSGATIVGGMTQKLNRKTAAEFSFFLAVPTMFGATAKKLFDYYQNGFTLTSQQINYLLIGNIIAFIVAMFAIKSFIDYLSKRGFKIFGYYRIIVGIAIIFIHFFVYKLTLI